MDEPRILPLPDEPPDPPPTPAGGAVQPPARVKYVPTWGGGRTDLSENQVEALVEMMERAWANGRLRLSVEQYADVLWVLFPRDFSDRDAAELHAAIAAERMLQGIALPNGYRKAG